MDTNSLGFYKILFDDLVPENIIKRFLELLLKLQNVERGSIWVRKKNKYVCIESLGSPTDTDNIKGSVISSKKNSIVKWVMENAQMTVAEVGKDPRHFKEFENRMNLKSGIILAYPLILKNGSVYGVVEIVDTSIEGKRLNLDDKYLDRLGSIIDLGAVALSNALNYNKQLEMNQELNKTLEEIRGEIPIIGQCRAFMQAMKSVRDYAKTDFPVLITGESGTGKDLIASAIHNLSVRKDKPFVVQNCSAIPDTLLESELFGYRKGAFTGATEHKIGLLQAADTGTVFLDEIGDMSMSLQARILRVVQNSEIKPLGESKISKINVRIISATNRDLTKAVALKEFREDLFYRLNVLPLHLPPLRARKKDIPLLLKYFIKREALTMGIPVKRISQEAITHIVNYPWEGNIRELENFIKYILSTVDGPVVSLKDIPAHFKETTNENSDVVDDVSITTRESAPDSSLSIKTRHSPLEGYTWRELEREYVIALLNRNHWNISRAAQESGIKRSTFVSRMRKIGIHKGRPSTKSA